MVKKRRFFITKKLLSYTHPTFSTIDKLSRGMCFGVSYRWSIRFWKLQFCPWVIKWLKNDLFSFSFFFLQKILVSKHVLQQPNNLLEYDTFWCVIRCQNCFYTGTGEQQKNDIFCIKEWFPELLIQPRCRSYFISLDMIWVVFWMCNKVLKIWISSREAKGADNWRLSLLKKNTFYEMKSED